MATLTASLNTKISLNEKEEFQRNTEALGLTPSAAIKIFVHMFNECGGFPFEVRRSTAQTTTFVTPDEYDSFAQALEEPLPAATAELLQREYAWGK